MSKVKVNTQKVKDITNQINIYINDYEENVDKLFNNLNELEHYWHGSDATAFLKLSGNIKKEYKNISIISKQYIKVVNEIMDGYER